MASVSAARRAAFRILLAVDGGKAHSDDLLRGSAVNALAAVDRNLATALVLGTLRWQIALDAQIRNHLQKPNAKLDAAVRIALRMGAFQLLHMDRIPARAAIDESVELTKQAGHRFASGMVNAVLRKVAAGGAELSASAETDAYPAWMTERWAQQFGEDAACAICRHGQAQAANSIRITNEEAEAELGHAGVQLEAAELVRAARTVLRGDVSGTAAFREGRVRIQDEGSQLVGEIAAFAGLRAARVLDACAAPGGKTLILAERNAGAQIVACEASAERHKHLCDRLAPLGERVTCTLGEVAAMQFEDEFDLVLADVPCSGTGTLGRNPEIRHRIGADEFARQAERQRAILSAAVRAAGGGGRVVYSTCSLEREENEDVVAAVMAAKPGLRTVPLATLLEAMEHARLLREGAGARLRGSVSGEGFLRLMPGAFGTDGFFVAVLEKEM